MKLEYLPEGGEMCPLVRIYEFNVEDAQLIHSTFSALANGSLQRVSLEEIVSLDSADGCRISFARGDADEGVVQIAKSEFEVVLTTPGWLQTANLAEPFCGNCSMGYQWLTNAGKINFLFSQSGQW